MGLNDVGRAGAADLQLAEATQDRIPKGQTSCEKRGGAVIKGVHSFGSLFFFALRTAPRD